MAEMTQKTARRHERWFRDKGWGWFVTKVEANPETAPKGVKVVCLEHKPKRNAYVSGPWGSLAAAVNAANRYLWAKLGKPNKLIDESREIVNRLSKHFGIPENERIAGYDPPSSGNTPNNDWPNP